MANWANAVTFGQFPVCCRLVKQQLSGKLTKPWKSSSSSLNNSCRHRRFSCWLGAEVKRWCIIKKARSLQFLFNILQFKKTHTERQTERKRHLPPLSAAVSFIFRRVWPRVSMRLCVCARVCSKILEKKEKRKYFSWRSEKSSCARVWALCTIVTHFP